MNNAIVVEVSNRQAAHPVDENLLTNAVRNVVIEGGFESAEISLVIVDDHEMHQLNVQYLDHDYPTDVLSFVLAKEDGFLAGEVIVSADTANLQGAQHGNSTKTEMALYVIHGTLHLVGYDDKQPEKRQVMREKEKIFMQKIGLEFHSSQVEAD